MCVTLSEIKVFCSSTELLVDLWCGIPFRALELHRFNVKDNFTNKGDMLLGRLRHFLDLTRLLIDR